MGFLGSRSKDLETCRESNPVSRVTGKRPTAESYAQLNESRPCASIRRLRRQPTFLSERFGLLPPQIQLIKGLVQLPLERLLNHFP